MKLALIDTETTGLDSKIHRVLEFALQVVEVTPTEVRSLAHLEFRQRVNLNLHAWSPEALRVNGYYDGHPDWADAPPAGTEAAATQWGHVLGMTEGLCLCSQNVPFDAAFITAELSRLRLVPAWNRRMVDIQSYSFLIAIEKGLEKFGLHDVYAACGGPVRQEHRAAADVERGLHVLRYVHRRMERD